MKNNFDDFDFDQMKKWRADHGRLEPVNLMGNSFFRCFLLSKLTQEPFNTYFGSLNRSKSRFFNLGHFQFRALGSKCFYKWKEKFQINRHLCQNKNHTSELTVPFHLNFLIHECCFSMYDITIFLLVLFVSHSNQW